YVCPFAQRVWITRNFKPAWYKEMVYSEKKVHVVVHKGKIIGESLGLIKYLANTFRVTFSLPRGDPSKETSPVLDYLENALYKVDGGCSSLERNKIDGYAQTKINPNEIVEIFEKKFMQQLDLHFSVNQVSTIDIVNLLLTHELCIILEYSHHPSYSHLHEACEFAFCQIPEIKLPNNKFCCEVEVENLNKVMAHRPLEDVFSRN
ncbi:hypothetical protein CARUB_v10002624mg, partial [Capsella rubella]